MRVLLVGNGAREHAIAWKLRQSPAVTDLLVAPGNAGTAKLARNVPLGPSDVEGLLKLAKNEEIDLTVVGPEGPLALGIVDRFQEDGQAIFGPTQSAARIETSKSFAKELMLLNDVPTASARTFSSYADARRYVDRAPTPLVVKADGLAAGKGVIIAQDRTKAQDALRVVMEERRFGDAGDRVMVEEYLEGMEVSVFAFVDAEYVSPLVVACDYKRVGDGDVGPNTGGMGSFSPPQVWNQELEDDVRKIMERVARALTAAGAPYRGVLYAGLMLTSDGPRVLEFNCRLGDPETQVILPRLEADLAQITMAAAEGRLNEAAIRWDPEPCVGVVLASGGYPGDYVTGHPIDGLEDVDDDVMVFHAGTKLGNDDATLTDGGRVLTVAAVGETLEAARTRAYANVGRIRFEDAYHRSDIAALDHDPVRGSITATEEAPGPTRR